MLPSTFKAAAVLLAAALVMPVAFHGCGEKEPAQEPAAEMKSPDPATEQQETMRMTLTIEGMTCEHCVKTLTRVLSACPGVTKVEIFLEAGEALITGTDLDLKAFEQAIQKAGGGVYKITKAE